MAETSPFFKLPAELRNEIYRYLVAGWHDVRAPTILNTAADIKFNRLNFEGLDLATPKVLDHYPADLDYTTAAKDDEARAKAKEDWKAITQVLKVSRQMYDEASAILYNKSKFNLKLYLSHLEIYRFLNFGALRERSLRRMRYVRIEVFDDKEVEMAAVFEVEYILRRLAHHLTALSRLEVGFHLFDTGDTWDLRGKHGLLEDRHMLEVLSAFTVERSLKFRIWQILSQPSFDHKRYERRACRLAEEKDMMGVGMKEMKRLCERWIEHISEWKLWPMDEEWLELQRALMTPDQRSCTEGRLMGVDERIIDQTDGVGEPLRFS